MTVTVTGGTFDLQRHRRQHYGDRSVIARCEQTLRAIYGRVDRIRQVIDDALHNDDIQRRCKVMTTLKLPTCFPLPQGMRQTSTTAWVTWMRDESTEILAELDEEANRRQDPDDPFDGTASGIFSPL